MFRLTNLPMPQELKYARVLVSSVDAYEKVAGTRFSILRMATGAKRPKKI